MTNTKNQKIYLTTVEGISPLIVCSPHALDGSLPEGAEVKPLIGPEKSTHEALTKLYLTTEGKLYQPADHFEACLVEAGKHKKVPGKKGATYSKAIGYAVQIFPREIIHVNQKWRVYTTQCKGGGMGKSTRIITSRPILMEWSLEFEVHFDESEIRQSELKEIFDIAGKIVGIGNRRPSLKGVYGKFQVTQWKELKTSKYGETVQVNTSEPNAEVVKEFMDMHVNASTGKAE